MAKRKDRDAAEGFQIPIEDANEESAAEDKVEAKVEAAGEEVTQEAATEAEAAEAAEAAGDAEDAGEGAAGAEAAGDSGADADAADPDSNPDAADPDADLIAEAEAIVEEASATEQLEAAQAKAADWQDRYMRLHAEWDTYRRRMGEQRAEEKARATESLMNDLLPVLDDFERTVAYAAENGETGLLEGVKAVQSKLLDALKKSGLQVIDPAGEPYEALEAQAVQMVPDEKAFEETVKDVFQKGYKMGKKVLRAAMVTVTTGGPKRPKDDEEAED